MLLKHGASAETKNNVSTVPPFSLLAPLLLTMMVDLYHTMNDDNDDAVPVRHAADVSFHRVAGHHCTLPALKVMLRWWRCC